MSTNISPLEDLFIRAGYKLRKAEGIREINSIRRKDTRDIVERIGVIPPYHVFLNNFPLRNPAAVFNPAITIDFHNEVIRVYARVVVGYYKYVSAITELRVPLTDIYDRTVSSNYYASTIIIYPSSKYDRWGAEDPRVYEINKKIYMTYVGRTVNYFNPAIQKERTLPITAVYEGNNTWRKIIVHKPHPSYADFTVSDKDAYITSLNYDDRLWLFHRPHLRINNKDFFPLLASNIKPEELKEGKEIKEITSYKPTLVATASHFESKIGWATPPIILKQRTLITLIHGVDAELVAYRVFALELEMPKSEDEAIIIKAVTPTYIMAPQKNYELFGDMPCVVFPTGLWRLDKDAYLLAYGAADFMIGLGIIKIDDLLAQLDKGRIY